MSNDNNDIKQQALDYHSTGRPGKIEVRPTKPFITSEDLSMAYSPGVAHPCLEIAKDPNAAFKYTAKGNLVGVISNGTAVLGLGNIGALAGKPVMEGKGILFKRFADIDVFDIEVEESTVEGMVNVIKSLEPTFGGINLEDIKAPECFEIEKQLIEKMNIPVFHDDQHGTAIIASAGFINALEVVGKKIGDVKVVFSGAGAAAMSCAKLFYEIGVKKENLVMCDSKGVIHTDRKEGMNSYKEDFAIKTAKRTLADAMIDADAFMGCSARGVLTKDMVKTMAKDPIIFAMANPEPEIYPHEAHEVRDDVIMATGRSDFPNQVNNVLGFPFIFRGALDVRATTINLEMKLAAVHALADLAKEEITEEVKLAYGNKDFTFGKEYIIPKPFDTRVLTRVTPAVAKAAMETGVARIEIKDFNEYASNLEARLGSSAEFMKSLRDRLNAVVAKDNKKVKVVFAEGKNTRILEAILQMRQDNKIEPILLGDKATIHTKLKKLGIDQLDDIQIITPQEHPKFKDYYFNFCKEKEREGITLNRAQDLMSLENYFGSMLVKDKQADCLISGPTLNFSDCFRPAMKVIGTQDNIKASGTFILTFKNRVLFLADCTAQIEPSEESLSQIALTTAQLYRKLMKKEPRIAFLSFSSFGSNNHPKAKRVRKAVELTKRNHPELMVEGEMQADVAVNKFIMEKLFTFSTLDKAADILIFPDLNSANISYKLLSQLSDTTAIGPIIGPMNNSMNIIQRTANITEIVNITTLTAVMSKEV